MTLYKVYYEGIFEGENEHEAEWYASRNRVELQHKKTMEIEDLDKDLTFDLDDTLANFFESFVPELDKFKNIDLEDAQLLLKDYDRNIKIFLTNLKESKLVGLVKLTADSIENPEEIAVVELEKDLIPLYMGAWIKEAEVEK